MGQIDSSGTHALLSNQFRALVAWKSIAPYASWLATHLAITSHYPPIVGDVPAPHGIVMGVM